MRTTGAPRHDYGSDKPPEPRAHRSRAPVLAVLVACVLAIVLAMARGELPPERVEESSGEIHAAERAS